MGTGVSQSRSGTADNKRANPIRWKGQAKCRRPGHAAARRLIAPAPEVVSAASRIICVSEFFDRPTRKMKRATNHAPCMQPPQTNDSRASASPPPIRSQGKERSPPLAGPSFFFWRRRGRESSRRVAPAERGAYVSFAGGGVVGPRPNHTPQAQGAT